MFSEFILTVLFLVGLLLYYVNRRPKNYPPGPFIWPIVGNLLQLGMEPYKTLLQMRDTYGDIIGIQFGSRRSIFINDVKIMKEAFSLHAFSGRPLLKHTLHPDSLKRRGLGFGDGAEGIEQRRFIVKHLRDFGFGKKSMEALIQEEVGDLVEGLLKTVGQPLDTHVRFHISVINALWTIVSGEKFSHDDPKIKKLMDLLAAIMSSTKTFSITIPFQWLGDIAPGLSGFNDYMANFRPILAFINDTIETHKKTYEKGQNRDLIDCFIEEMGKVTTGSSFHEQSGRENLQISVFDLFMAGAETTSTTLTWVCFLLAHHPECQEKLTQAIVKTIGTTTPSLADRPNIPYLEAVIMEVLRYSALVQFGVLHETKEDVQLRGYLIPKGTWVIANQFGILHDPKVWGDPENFRPERFLSEDGKAVLRHESLIPFSVGKRVCLGESLAKDELFLFTAGLVQRFKVEFDPNEPIPKMAHSIHTLVLAPVAHKIVFSDRYE